MIVTTFAEMKKARGGPYYGPRGGKWADAAHKIPWKRQSVRAPLDDSYDGVVAANMNLAQAEKAISTQLVEHAVLFSSNGKILYRAKGKKSECFVPPDMVKHSVLDGNAVFTHNHPTGLPLSTQDIYMAVRLNLKEMRVVTHRGGQRYVIRRPKDGWGHLWEPGTLAEPGFIHNMVGMVFDAGASNARRRMDDYIKSKGGHPANGAEDPNFNKSRWDEILGEEIFAAYQKHLPWKVTEEVSKSDRDAGTWDRFGQGLPADLLKAHKLQGRLDFQGMKISVENRKGSKRHWRDEHSGESGSTTMKHPYGYIRMTEGTDGDHVDVYVGPNHASQKVYVVNQMKKPDFKKFDEQKVMLGFDTAKDARAAYLTHYNNPGFLGEMFVQDIDTFKEKVYATKNGGSKMVGKAGGPYYGPRGGKWEDPGHTISWDPKKKKPAPVSYHKAKHNKADLREQLRVSDKLEFTKGDVEAVRMWFEMPAAYQRGKSDKPWVRIKGVRDESAKRAPKGAAARLLALIDQAEQLNRRSVTLYRGLKIPARTAAKLTSAKTFNDVAVSSWTTDPEDALMHSYIGSMDDRDGTSVILRMTTKKGVPINSLVRKLQERNKEAQDSETILRGMKTKVTKAIKWYPYGKPGFGDDDEPSILLDLEHL